MMAFAMTAAGAYLAPAMFFFTCALIIEAGQNQEAPLRAQVGISLLVGLLWLPIFTWMVYSTIRRM